MRQLILTTDLPEKDVFGRDLPIAHYRRYLGQTLTTLAFDASGGLFPNAFAALAGTLQENGKLFLHLPHHYPAGDPDHQRLADFADDPFYRLHHPSPRQFYHHFNARLGRYLQATQSTTAEVEREQKTATFTTVPQIFLGRRGRGKTTHLAQKMAWLRGKNPATRFLVVAPFANNVAPLIQLLQKEKMGIFLPPDDAIFRHPPADYLIVDEASAMPAAQLLTLLSRYPNFSLAATQEGYEGTARTFSLRTLPTILRQFPHVQTITLQRPHRYQHNDPLEWILDQAFLLHGSAKSASTGLPTDFRAIFPLQLAQDEALLRQIYALLRDAHYRTTPEDLKRLLDLPDQSLFIAENDGVVCGVLHILHESPHPPELAAEIIAGKRRPRGRLLLQQLLQKTQNPLFNRPLARISRIAVHQNVRRRGIGAALIALAKQSLPEPLGVSFARDEALCHFWRALGFVEMDREGRNSLQLYI